MSEKVRFRDLSTGLQILAVFGLYGLIKTVIVISVVLIYVFIILIGGV